ncbi:MAG: SoxR reducing system RseC family protein [Phycisphaerales bacterium]|nr:SoxR reducing system RseC family protein [Phycisphaerales bacterium]
MRFLENFGQGCGNCHHGEGCGVDVEAARDVDLECRTQHGVSLALATALVFIVPLAAALAGAWCLPWLSPVLGEVELATAGGAVAGFLIGVGAVRFLFRWFRPRPVVTEATE